MARSYYEYYPDTLDWANSEGKTALHVASLRGNEELVRVGRNDALFILAFLKLYLQMLCDSGADFDLSDNDGNTPLH